VGPASDVRFDVTRDLGNLRELRVPAPARPSLGWVLRNWLSIRRREMPAVIAHGLLGRIAGTLRFESALSGMVYRPDLSRLAPEHLRRLKEMLAANFPVEELPRYFGGDVLLYGTLSRRLITTAGVTYMVDAFQNLTELENFKFHGFGTGGAAEAVGNTALTTELTTQYVTDNVRPTGSQTENGATVYRTVGTLSPDSGGTIAITEHGLFSADAAGTLWDRSLFAAVNLVAGSDSLQVTHDTTIAAGG
jgi:hypothetical protein